MRWQARFLEVGQAERDEPGAGRDCAGDFRRDAALGPAQDEHTPDDLAFRSAQGSDESVCSDLFDDHSDTV